MSVRFSVIVATQGRPSLARALQSLADQPLAADDEVLVVGQAIPAIVDVAAAFGSRFVACPPGGDWGHTERQVAMPLAQGTHLVALDDDDVYQPGAFRAMRAACAAHPGRPLMFRMIAPWGATLWRDRQVREGNHGTPQFVPPNDPARLGTYGTRYAGDFDFVVSTLAHYPPDALVWDPTVTYVCRPEARA